MLLNGPTNLAHIIVHTHKHVALEAMIWNIANRLRGLYLSPQFRLAMLPMFDLHWLDRDLEPTKYAVLKRL